MRLNELQQAVQAHILAGGDAPAELLAAVAPPADVRWRIYADGYRLRLIEALAAQYPVLAARLGPEIFPALVVDFIEATPSVHRSIRDYGAELETFFAERGHGVEDRMLGELAAFEWRLAGAFDAPHATATLPADLAGVQPADWATLAFVAVPAVQRLRTQTNAVAVWRTLKAAEDVPVSEPSPSETKPAAEIVDAVEWLIYRRELSVEFRSLAPDEAAAFDLLTGGTSFGDLCGALAEAGSESPALQAAGWLKGWLTEGVLLRI